MKTKEIRELSVVEIKKAVNDAEKELFMMKLRRQMGQLEATHRIRSLRRHLARLKTIVHEKSVL